ncbi:ribonuclease D [Galenea microaerophila]
MKINYIVDEKTLADICQQMAQCDWIAVDTEFLRTNTYYPELCLIQIQSCTDQTYLIDPLALSEASLQPLWQLFSNPNVTKVFHSARQDLEVLYLASSQLPTPIFDTQIAALFLGYGDSVGFAKLVESLLGKSLAKTQTRTDWRQRPLNSEQLQYAAEDVLYLAPLYQKLRQQLTTEQLSALEEDFKALQNPALYLTSPESAAAKLLENRHMSPKQMAIVHALAAWREQHAQALNQPRKWVLTDELIYDLAKRPPKTVQALYKLPQLKSSDIQQFGETWIDLIDQVFAHPESWPEKPAKPPKLTSQQQKLSLLIQAWIQQVAEAYQIPVNHLLHKPQLTQLILTYCDPLKVEKHQKILQGWRHLLIEKPIQALCQQKACLKIENGTLKLEGYEK